MYTVTIIPHIEPRRKDARWSKTFEEVPTKAQLKNTLKTHLAELNAALEGEDIAANTLRVMVIPVALEIVEHGGAPAPSTRGTKVITVFHAFKQLGSISIQ
jgi:hypothetical protein